MSLLHEHDHGDDCVYSISVPMCMDHEPDCPSYFVHPHMHCECDEEDDSSEDGSSVLTDCECENCEYKAANRVFRLHSQHSGRKVNGEVKKRFEGLQMSIKKFIDEETKKQANQNSAMDQVARQESNVKLLEAKLKSQELELCILRLNAKEITFNSQMIKNAMKISSAGIPYRPESTKKSEEVTRTVNI